MSDDTLKEALEAFKLAQDAESENREDARDDLRFARLGEQWDEKIRKKRDQEDRPCLTINKLTAFIRQVVNDGRLNKPSIKVHPADSFADPKTATIINGLIRNIEVTSNADVAYDTGLEYAATIGFGYWRVAMDYAHDDTFDMDLRIDRISNPFSVYGDPFDRGADSSGWNNAFITDMISKKEFERKYKGAEKVDWAMGDYADIPIDWAEGENIQVAEWWHREQVKRKIVKLSDGRVVDAKLLTQKIDGFTMLDVLQANQITVTGERDTNSFKVVQRIMNGVEVLEKNDWPGIYIPIISVFGEEVNVEGKRYLRSLIRDAKDPQRMFNYWRTVSTELVALSPKMPFVGAKGAFNTDIDKWNSANTDSHAFIEYDSVPGEPPPQRQPFAGPPAGALQEALNASDDMKAVIGMYDASLGARSNETSGVAINARKQEGDVSTFHFTDNQSRAIRHTGRVLIDLIPHTHNQARIARIMGEDKKPQNVPINQPLMGPDGQPMLNADGTQQIYDLTVGKYDLTVETGANFTTQREEASAGMTEFMHAVPQAAVVIAPHLAKLQDWPDADRIAEELAALAPNAGGQNPEVQQLQQQLQQQGQQMQQMDGQAKEAIGQLNQKLQQAQADKSLEAQKLQIDQFNAETNRMKAMHDMQPEAIPEAVAQVSPAQVSEAEKMQFEAEVKIRLEDMRNQAAKELELLKQRGAAMQSDTSGMNEYDGDLNVKGVSPAIGAIQALMEQTIAMQKLLSAPRRKTIIRGIDGRPESAIEEIIQQESGNE